MTAQSIVKIELSPLLEDNNPLQSAIKTLAVSNKHLNIDGMLEELWRHTNALWQSKKHPFHTLPSQIYNFYIQIDPSPAQSIKLATQHITLLQQLHDCQESKTAPSHKLLQQICDSSCYLMEEPLLAAEDLFPQGETNPITQFRRLQNREFSTKEALNFAVKIATVFSELEAHQNPNACAPAILQLRPHFLTDETTAALSCAIGPDLLPLQESLRTQLYENFEQFLDNGINGPIPVYHPATRDILQKIATFSSCPPPFSMEKIIEILERYNGSTPHLGFLILQGMPILQSIETVETQAANLNQITAGHAPYIVTLKALQIVMAQITTTSLLAKIRRNSPINRQVAFATLLDQHSDFQETSQSLFKEIGKGCSSRGRAFWFSSEIDSSSKISRYKEALIALVIAHINALPKELADTTVQHTDTCPTAGEMAAAALRCAAQLQ
jgi:hypothetical protein